MYINVFSPCLVLATIIALCWNSQEASFCSCVSSINSTRSCKMRSCLLLAAIAGLASAAPQPEKRQYIDYEAVVADFVTTVTETPGLKTQTVHYDPTAAISSAAADTTEDPLSQKKRNLQVRSACDPEPTIANTYNIDSSSPSNFQNDPNAAAAANGAATPSGYSQSFKGLTSTVIGYGYLGYQQISSYDPSQCATRCRALAGCLGFNLCKSPICFGGMWHLLTVAVFERAPIVTPGDACPNPTAFANIKCAFWGGPVDAVGAQDSNDTRSSFQVSGHRRWISVNFTTYPLSGRLRWQQRLHHYYRPANLRLLCSHHFEERLHQRAIGLHQP